MIRRLVVLNAALIPLALGACAEGLSPPSSTNGCTPSSSDGGLSVLCVSPPSGTAAGSELVVVVGSGFESGASVTFGTLPALQTTFIDARDLWTLTPPSPAGQVDVTVQNPDGGQAVLEGGYYFIPE